MQESYGTSPSGNLKEAVRGISNPGIFDSDVERRTV